MEEFDESAISKLQADPLGYALQVIETALGFVDSGPDWTKSDYRALAQACALVIEASEAKLLDLSVSPPELDGGMASDCHEMREFLKEVEKVLITSQMRGSFTGLRSRFKIALSNSFAYQFSEGDLNRIQELINQLREQITIQAGLEDDHRQRLLRRLEKLQSELHKKMSDLDRFWGLIGDAGVVLGKLGNDAKPIVDRIREVADIVWQTQSRAEELPSGTHPPLLEQRPHNDNMTT